MDRRIEEKMDECREEEEEGKVKLGERRRGRRKKGEINKDSRDEI